MFTDRRRVLALLAGAFATPAFAQTAPMTRITAYAFSFPGLEGADIKLAEHVGKPILVVNTASLCGYTPQYAGLQHLWARYHARGLLIVGGTILGARSRAVRPTSHRRPTANTASAFPSRRRYRSRDRAHIPSTDGRRASAPSKPRAGTFTSTSLAAMVILPRFLLPRWNRWTRASSMRSQKSFRARNKVRPRLLTNCHGPGVPVRGKQPSDKGRCVCLLNRN
jgi:glutathione peroxidase